MSDLVMTRAQRLGHAAATPVRVVTEVVASSAVLGVIMGVVWWLLAPDITGVVVDGGLAADSQEAQKLFDRDAIFALLGAAGGLLLAVTFIVRHPRRPVTVVITVAVCGVGSSLLAQLIGHILGPDGNVEGIADGTRHPFPLQMDSPAGLLVWSMVATVVVAVVAVFRQDLTPWSVSGKPSR